MLHRAALPPSVRPACSPLRLALAASLILGLSLGDQPAFGQVIQIQPGGKLRMARPGGPNAEGEEGDPVDDAATFLTNRETLQKMAQAEDLTKNARYAEAVLFLGNILNGAEDYFYRPDRAQASYRSVKSRALELIGSMPAAGREAYELEYGADGQRKLEEAIRSGSPKQMEEVARRYFHTQAGYEAMHRLALYQLDRGQPLAAALCFKRLQAIPEVAEKLEPTLSLRLAACLLSVGSEEAEAESVQVMQGLKYKRPETTLILAGKRVPLPVREEINLAWMQNTVGTMFRQAQPGNEEWVMHRGNPARNAPSVGGAPLLNARWTIPVADDDAELERRIKELQAGHKEAQTISMPGLFPLAVKLNPREASVLNVGAIRTTRWPAFVGELRTAGKSGEPKAIAALWGKLSPALQQSLNDAPADGSPDKAVKQQLVDEMNALFAQRDSFDEAAFAHVDRRTEAGPLMRISVEKRSDDEVFRLNRLVFESMFPRAVVRSFADVVLMRTTSKLLAIDFATGKRVWDVPLDGDNDPIKRLMQSDVASTSSMQTGQLASGLGRRLWHDATFGSLSSDGRLVFSIEDLGVHVPMPMNYSGMRMVNHQANSPLAPKDYNRLVAHDIRTGKLVWEVGGAKSENERRLAGLYFLGPPLPLAGQLYALAESGAEVRLVVLNAQTGDVAWSQNLCEARTPINQSTFRGRSGVSPSYSDGVLVCPTSAGAVVAVDLTSRSLLWGYRYNNLEIDPQAAQGMVFGQGNPGFATPSDERWSDSLCIVADGNVLVTPIESDEIHCLKLTDGSLVWKKQRGDSLYTACVHDGNVIVVGKQQVTAYKLTDGEQIWQTSLEATVHPSGRGFLSGNFYHLPLSSSEVAGIDLANGRVVARSKSRVDRAPGNLICFKGTVISQGVDYLQSFDELSGLEAQIENDLLKNPNDADALARQGEVMLQRGHVDQAIATFRKSLNLRDDAQTRELLVSSLLEGLRVDYAANREAAKELETLLPKLPDGSRGELQLRFLRLTAQGRHAAGERIAAFATYLEFVQPDIGKPEVERIEGMWSVRRDRWVQGRLLELFADSSPEEKTEMEAELQRRFDSAVAHPTAAPLEAFVAHFSQHPLAEKARLALVPRLMSDGQLLKAELVLMQLRKSKSIETRAAATALLGDLLIRADRPLDAAVVYRSLAAEYGDVVAREGKTGTELVAQSEAVKALVAAKPKWPVGNVQSNREQNNANRMMRYFAVEMRGEANPFFGQGSIFMDQQARRFVGRDRFGRQLWEMSLTDEGNRPANINLNPFANTAETCGHLVLLSTGQHLMAIDTLSRNSNNQAVKLWEDSLTQNLPTGVVGQPVRFQLIARNGQRMLMAQDLNGNPLGPAGPVRSDYVCFVRMHDLIALDPMTGQKLWVRNDVQAGSQLYGDDEYIFVQAPGKNEITVIRAADGKKLFTRPAPEESHQIAATQRRMVVWRNENGKETLKATDLVTNEEVWKETFDAASRIAVSDGKEEAAVVQPDGQVKIVRLTDGKLLCDGKVEQVPNMNEMYLLRSEDHFLLVCSQPWMANNNQMFINAVNGGMDNPVVNGRIHGFDRESGKLIWSTQVENQSLALRQPMELPVLTLAASIQRRQGANGAYVREVEVLVIDKRNGRTVYKNLFNENILGVDVEADPDAKTVQIKLMPSTVVLKFTDEPIPESEAKP